MESFQNYLICNLVLEVERGREEFRVADSALAHVVNFFDDSSNLIGFSVKSEFVKCASQIICIDVACMMLI
jgi:hypothetical protein